MLLKSIELENIRSYVKERIEFPAGTTLLSGDVGCGKSTVLLAIEFALFGIQRGELAGTDMLRHGSNDGHIQLCFEVGGREIVVSRSLKRDKKGVSQEAGWVQIEGMKHSKTTSELRAIILEILGYPLEYQTKNPIVFRYTVYTPQDEMKRILFGLAEERLGILRKIFQIDKYGRIRTNAESIVIREFRAMKREAESSSSDLEKIISEAESTRAKLELLGCDLRNEQTLSESIAKEFSEKNSEAEKLFSKIKALGKLAQSVATKESFVKERKLRNQRIMVEESELATKIVALERSVDVKPSAPELTERECLEKKHEMESKRLDIISKCSLLGSEIRKYGSILDKGCCDFCGQNVSDKHAFSHRIENCKAELTMAENESKDVVESIASIERQQSELAEYSYKIRIFITSERELKEKRERSDSLIAEREKNIREVNDAENELLSLCSELSQLPELEATERKAKAELSKLQSNKIEFDRALARIESQIESMTRELGKAEKEIVEKQKMRSLIVKLNSAISWLEQTFVPVIRVMEQTVMTTVQREFNNVFQAWFGMLMGEENLSVEADDRFAPIITQEGYQTDYQNLSGGEKTAVALAYRLALNKAINSLIENIRTKDLIILDEPTDGFSSEQIDRIRDVLAELNLRQMILVSHETKIETFVENVIRFHKEGHLSKVVR